VGGGGRWCSTPRKSREIRSQKTEVNAGKVIGNF